MKSKRLGWWAGIVGVLLSVSVATQLRAQDEEGASAPEPDAATVAGAPDETASADAAAVTESAPITEGFISVDFKDADIRQVLRIISLKSGVDIVAGTDVEGLVTIKLTDVPWQQAMDIILRTYGFTYEQQGRIVRVMTIDALEKEALQTRVFPLNYANSKNVPDVLKEMLSDRGRVKFDERTNTVIVTDIPANLFQIQQVVERLDQRTPQVLIQTKVVETRLNKNETLGIDWSSSMLLTQTIAAGGIDNNFPFGSNTSFGEIGNLFGFERAPGRPNTNFSTGTLSFGSLTATLNWLRQRTDTHIVSNPNISVLDNQEAKIHIGEEFPIPNYTIDPTTGRTTISGYTAKNIGTVLTVTPHVNPSNEIVVDLKPEVIAALDEVSYSTGQNSTIELPRFSVQTAKTQVRIKDGETIAIGGLVKTANVSITEKVPFLGDIPFFGIWFQNTSRHTATGSSDPVRQDLLIFLTVKLEEEKGGAGEQTLAAAGTN